MDLNLPPKVTDRAFARLAEINEASGDAKALRVAVEGGGCSGFQYDIRLDEPAEDDLVLEGSGQKVVVDSVSLPFLANAVIDFSEELIEKAVNDASQNKMKLEAMPRPVPLEKSREVLRTIIEGAYRGSLEAILKL